MSKGGAPRFSEEWLAQRLSKQAPPSAPPEQKPSKYRNEKAEVDGIKFDSKAEAGRWRQLELMEKAGIISDLQRQVPFGLIDAQRKSDGKIERAVTYVADFTYMEDGRQIVEDVKGMRTREYILKRKLMLKVHGIEIREHTK